MSDKTLMYNSTYTFNADDAGRCNIIATFINDSKTLASKQIIVKEKAEEEELVVLGTTTSPFVTGYDIKYLSLLYEYNENHGYTCDELNSATITYITDNNANAEQEKDKILNGEEINNLKFFAEDEKGIYALLKKEDSTLNYSDSCIVIINETEYIKAYVKGTCEIIDAIYDNDLNMITSPAYPFSFYDDNSSKYITYLFINRGIELLYKIDSDKLSFQYKSLEEKTYHIPTEKEKLYINNTINDAPYIIKNAVNKTDDTINSIYNPINKIPTTHKDGTIEEVAMMLTGGTVRKIIFPETIKIISHFCAMANNTDIILPNSLEEIGESAFEGIQAGNGSIQIKNYQNSKLKIIGKYAFAHIGNINIFPHKINNYSNSEEFINFITNDIFKINTNCIIKNLNGDNLKNTLIDMINEININSAITILPIVDIIDDYAFFSSSNSTSISSIIFTNITTKVGIDAFSNAGILQAVIPQALIARPRKNDINETGNTDIINHEKLLYLPKNIMLRAGSTITDDNTNIDRLFSNKYTYLMKGAYVDGGVEDAYSYSWIDSENETTETQSNMWILDDLYRTYRIKSQEHSTFDNLSGGSKHFRFISDSNEDDFGNPKI